MYRLINNRTKEVLYSNKDKKEFLFIANMIFKSTQIRGIYTKNFKDYFVGGC